MPVSAPLHRTNRATPAQLKELRTLRVAVPHPDDADGRQPTQQLQRIGCQVQASWPPVPTLPDAKGILMRTRNLSEEQAYDLRTPEVNVKVVPGSSRTRRLRHGVAGQAVAHGTVPWRSRSARRTRNLKEVPKDREVRRRWSATLGRDARR